MPIGGSWVFELCLGEAGQESHPAIPLTCACGIDVKHSGKHLGRSWKYTGQLEVFLGFWERSWELFRGLGTLLKRSWGPLGCVLVASRVLEATIKEYQYTRHQYWITRHALGQRPSKSKANICRYGDNDHHHDDQNDRWSSLQQLVIGSSTCTSRFSNLSPLSMYED